MAKITLWGLEHYLNQQSKSLFDNLTVPVGMDKATLTDSIMLDGGEFGVVYSDADFLREAIGKWSAKYSSTFTRWYEVWTKEYNPLYNFDRMEISSDNENHINKNIGKSNNTANGLHQLNTANKVDSESENKVSAFDSSTYEPKDKNITGSTSTNRGSDSTTNHSKTNSDDTFVDTKGLKHKGHLFGNIGVTQTTELLANEVAFRAENSPYKLITDLFVVEFLIGIY